VGGSEDIGLWWRADAWAIGRGGSECLDKLMVKLEENLISMMVAANAGKARISNRERTQRSVSGVNLWYL
jgi:hypothetical protein